MPDRLTPTQRHLCMSHIHSRDTKPELLVRKWLWQHGYRYRLNVKGVPGKPDIVMRRYRTAIFVNGCFWHGHDVELEVRNEKLEVVNSDCCKIPNTNREFWINKIRRNQERDRQNYQVLQDNGWQVIVIWECRLTSSKIESTMQKVEIQLHDYFLKTCSKIPKTYVLPNEDDFLIAAEEQADYGF